MSLLVMGTVALDNVKTPSGLRRDLLGGSATHFAMSASLLTKVHLVAVIGKDFPERHIRFLTKKGIDITSLIVKEGTTFRWEGEYKKEDLNTALTRATQLGVLEGYIPEVAVHQRNTPFVFLANFDPDIQMKLLDRMRKSKFVGLDSMNLWIELKKKSLLKLIRRVDLFVANEGEAKALSGESNLVKAAKYLRRLGPKFIMIKKGEHGVLFYSDSFKFSFPAYPVEQVVDPTGAGDTFAGGVMGYLSQASTTNEQTIKKAILYGTTLASFNVEGFGMAKTAYLTLKDVHQRMNELKKFISV